MDRKQILESKESLKENLSGEQIEFILNSLIHSPIEQLMKHTTLVEDTISESLQLIVANQKRKLAVIEGNDLVSAIFSIIISKDVNYRASALKELQLERSVYFRIFKNFDDAFNVYCDNLPKYFEAVASKDFEAQEQFYSAMIKAQKDLRLINNTLPYQEFLLIKENITKAYRFRSMLIEKYIRFVHQRAIKFRKGTSLNIDLDDLFKNLLVSIPKAIDKYRAEKGPLTTHIEWWLKDAITQNASSHEYGIAYHIPSSKRRKMQKSNETIQNFSSAIDDNVLEMEGEDSLEEKVLQSSNDTRLARIAAEADKKKMGFLELGFVYVLNPVEKFRLRKTLIRKTKNEKISSV